MRVPRILLTAFLALLAITQAASAVEFFPLAEVKVGMKGIGKTVVRGTNIEDFNVEVIDIIPDGGFDGRQLILAKFSGPVIQASNGIAEGYSGSPVYIRGKLLGAVSMAIPYSDTHIGGITPIENMLSALPRRHRPDYTGNTVIPEASVDRKLRFMESWDEAVRFNKEHPDGEIGAVPLVAPLVASGFSPESLALLEEKVQQYPFVHVTADAGVGGAGTGGALLYDPVTEGPLKAGDAVAISLMSGDIDLSAIGTATYVDEAGQVLMFGHPLMMNGDIDLVLQKAYIAYTYKSVYRAFKMGHSLYPVGAAKQDRASAVGGLLNVTADTLPVKVKVNDIDLHRTEEFSVQVTRDPDWFDYLIMIALEEAFSRTTDTGKGGTLRLEFSLEGAGLKEPLHRVNYYYSESYPTSGSWEELLPLTSLLANNIYREVKLTQVSVQLDFTRNRINAAIDDAELLLEGEKPKLKTKKAGDKVPESEGQAADAATETEADGQESENGDGSQEQASSRTQEGPVPMGPEPPAEIEPPGPGVQPKTVHAGDALRVNVHLQPFREEALEQMIHFTLPEDFPEGPTALTVHGGGGLLSIYNEFGGRGRILMGSGNFVNLPPELRDLDKIIEEALSTPLNNEIVVTILKPGVDPTGNQGANAGDEEWEPEFRVSVPTKWVIYEQKTFPIIVAKAVNGENENGEDGAEGLSEEPAEEATDAVG